MDKKFRFTCQCNGQTRENGSSQGETKHGARFTRGDNEQYKITNILAYSALTNVEIESKTAIRRRLSIRLHTIAELES